MSYDVDEDSEDVDVIELQVAGEKVGLAGIARASGTVYLSGDIHPMGAFSALMLAAQNHVPYISTSSVNALFPSTWLKMESLAHPDRVRIIEKAESFVRGS